MSMIKNLFNNVRTRVALRKVRDGKDLEVAVAELLKREGFKDVQMNVILKDSNGNRSEIDVIGKNRKLINRFLSTSEFIPYGTSKLYVECKHYSDFNRVELDNVAKFKEVCNLNKINLNNALFVTTSSYVPRATTVGVRTMDGDELRRWINADGVRKCRYWLGFSSVIFVSLSIFIYYLRLARVSNIAPITNFNSRRSCGTTNGPVEVTMEMDNSKINGDKALWISYLFYPPYPLETQERTAAEKYIDSSIKSTGISFLDPVKIYFNSFRWSHDYMVINFNSSVVMNKLSSWYLNGEANQVKKKDDNTYSLHLKAPHFLTVPHYFTPFVKYHYDNLVNKVSNYW